MGGKKLNQKGRNRARFEPPKLDGYLASAWKCARKPRRMQELRRSDGEMASMQLQGHRSDCTPPCVKVGEPHISRLVTTESIFRVARLTTTEAGGENSNMQLETAERLHDNLGDLVRKRRSGAGTAEMEVSWPCQGRPSYLACSIAVPPASDRPKGGPPEEHIPRTPMVESRETWVLSRRNVALRVRCDHVRLSRGCKQETGKHFSLSSLWNANLSWPRKRLGRKRLGPRCAAILPYYRTVGPEG